MLDALSIPLLILLTITALFITIFLHELGHAIPALLMTQSYQEITIYIGSFGDEYKSFRVVWGRLIIYCKYNPLLWYKGCCVAPDYDLSIDQKILFTAGGPLVSILSTIATWLLISAVQQADLLRIIAGSVFAVSLLLTLAFLIPDPRPRYTPSGHRFYSDSYQIFRLLKMKFS